MAILKTGVTRKESTPNFLKNEHFLTPARVRIRWFEIFVFWKIWRTLFSCNTCFKIRPFALLPTSYFGVDVLYLDGSQ